MEETARAPRVLAFTIILPALLAAGLLFSCVSDLSLATERPEPAAAVPAASAGLAATAPLRLMFFGDLMLDRHIREKLAGRRIDLLLGDLASSSPELFRGYDLIGANLEGAVADKGEHYPPVMAYDFSFVPERVGELKAYGFDFFNLANNHITDQGARGYRETRVNLEGLGLAFSGGADGTVGPDSETVIERSGRKIALIGFSMVYRDFDLAAAKKLVAGLREKADVIIVNIHWGMEYQHKFSRHQQEIGRALIDAGADAVIGHHPHVVQGVEVYKGKPIFYSLGNFIFDQYFSPDTQQGLGVSLEIGGARPAATLFPLQARSSAVRLMEGKTKEDFLADYAAWSAGGNMPAEAGGTSTVEIRF